MRLRIYISFTALALFFSLLNKALAQQIQPSALRQIQSLIDEKESRTPAQKKINSQILYAFKMQDGKPITPEVPSLRVNLLKDSQGRIKVNIKRPLRQSS